MAAYDGDGATVGFARALSDGVTSPTSPTSTSTVGARRRLGMAIVRAMVEDGPGRAFRWTLFTNDAHGLYARFGFAVGGRGHRRPRAAG